MIVALVDWHVVASGSDLDEVGLQVLSQRKSGVLDRAAYIARAALTTALRWKKIRDVGIIP